MLRPQRLRLLRAQWRDILILLRQFRSALLAFLILVCIGTLFFWFFYEHPGDHTRLTLSQSLFAAFSLLFFQTGNIDYPDSLLMDSLFYVVPICGLLTYEAVGQMLRLAQKRSPVGDKGPRA